MIDGEVLGSGMGDRRSWQNSRQRAKQSMRFTPRIMPELPEVETVRRGLERTLVGRRFDEVTVGRERVARRTSRKELRDGLTGARVVRVDRRGKYLLLELDADSIAMVHLRMSGQVVVDEGLRRHRRIAMSLQNSTMGSECCSSTANVWGGRRCIAR